MGGGVVYLALTSLLAGWLLAAPAGATPIQVLAIGNSITAHPNAAGHAKIGLALAEVVWSVPEPGSLGLVAAGLLVLAGMRAPSELRGSRGPRAGAFPPR